MPEYLLGVDVGTTACKTFLFNLNGDVIRATSEEYPIFYPESTWAEQNPDLWWKAVIKNMKQVLRKAAIKLDDILGIGVDSQREAPVLLDDRGKVLANSIIWLDRRTLSQACKIMEKVAQDHVLRVTGVPIDYIYSATKILWYKENVPRFFNKASKILFPKDYIIHKLSGEMVTDYSMASRTMLFDIHRLEWSDDICAKLEIPVDLLPEVKASWQAIGEVSSEAAGLLRIRKGIPVAGGGGDRPCEALAAGVINPGYINIGTGTGTTITTPLNSPKTDIKGRFECCCHVVPNRWEYEICLLATGASLKWFKDNFCYEEILEGEKNGISPYAYLDELAGKSPVGCNNLFYYPYLMGAKAPKFNDMAKGVFYGFTLSHTKPHFVRSILEGIAFQYAETIELLKDIDIHVKEASIVGGESKSGLWNQIKSDVMGKTIKTLRVADAAALGSAMLGGMASGIFNSADKAIEEMVKFKDVYNPDKTQTLRYLSIIKKYKKLYEFVEKGYKVVAHE